MKFFEYEVITLTGACSVRAASINQMALLGWRLVLVENGMAYFERKRSENA
jgi:hypothetical protein